MASILRQGVRKEVPFMGLLKNKDYKYYSWFAGGFIMGISLISLGHAALPTRATPKTNAQKTQAAPLVTEIQNGKVLSPELDQDFNKLNSLEAKYAESLDQQSRLKNATSRVARSNAMPVKKKKR
jgi:hypothetical protein